VFVSNKRQNGLTDRVLILCGTSHDPMEGLGCSKLQKICPTVFEFSKILKMREQILLIRELFYYCFLLYKEKIEIEDGRTAP